MKKFAFISCILISFTLNAQTNIQDLGLADYHGWPILNDSTTLDGDARTDGEIRDGWASLRGSFGQVVEVSEDIAISVSGQKEFIGSSGGSDYTAFRYALTHQAYEGKLVIRGY